MRTIRTAIISVTLLFAVFAEASVAREPFSAEKFSALQAQEALILVDVWARWCPTCAEQKKILDRYAAERPDSTLHILVVDFDEQKEWVRHFRAPRQSTLLLYKGEERLWYSVAETDAERIFRTLDSAAQ